MGVLTLLSKIILSLNLMIYFSYVDIFCCSEKIKLNVNRTNNNVFISTKANILTNRILNSKYSEENKTNYINDLIALIISSFGLRNIIIIYEGYNTISDQAIKHSKFYKYVNKLHLYPSQLNEFNKPLIFIFTKEHIKQEQTFFCIGSFVFINRILEIANEIDVALNQQGYFLHIHKWIIISKEKNSCSDKYLNQMDKLDNAICIDTKTNYMDPVECIPFQTAIYGYWQTVNCPLLLDNTRTCCSLKDIFPNTEFKMNNRHLRIGTNVHYKYVFRISNGEFSGMFIEFLQDLANFLNFTYNLLLPKDHQWGIMLPNGSWNGMIGELQRREIDFVVTALARNYYREQDMDYPDYDLATYHIAGIYKLPSQQITSIDLFAQSFSILVYILILAVVVASSSGFALRAMYSNGNLLHTNTQFKFIVFIKAFLDNVFLILLTFLGQNFALRGII